jgi:glycosyltransferase involved in cell wall biosynthesis
MRIAIVTHRLAPGEGQGRVNYEIARVAARAGHAVTCVAHDVAPDLAALPGITHAPMPSGIDPIALIGNMIFARASRHWLNAHAGQFDVVMSNGCNTTYASDISAVHFVHSAWRRSPVHAASIGSGPAAWYQWLYSYVNAWWEQRALHRIGSIIAVSSKVRDELVALGLPSDSIHVVHNGVDLEEFYPGPVNRTALGLPEDVPLGLFAGGIGTPRKNVDSVLQAMVKVPEMHLAILGSTEGSPYPALARQLGVATRAHFLGFRRDVPALMRSADFLAFPSRYEACSLVLLEALGTGLPIVTAKTAGGAELVNDDCGFVLPNPDDVDALANVLARLVADTSLRKRMSRAARAVAERHSWQQMADRYLELFAEAARAKSSGDIPIPSTSFPTL